MSLEFQNKSDYSFSAFGDNGFLYKKDYSHNIYKDCVWLTNSEKFKEWKYINVYARRTGRFLGRFYRENYIPQKPR